MNAKHPEWNPDSTEELRDMIGKGEEDKKPNKHIRVVAGQRGWWVEKQKKEK